MSPALQRWAGPIVAALIVVGAGAILLLNLDLRGDAGSRAISGGEGPSANPNAKAEPQDAKAGGGMGGIEKLIGEDEREHMEFAAVWLPAVRYEGGAAVAGDDVIHLEADVHATEGNPHGFARHEFVPYLRVDYRIEPESGAGGEPIEGTMVPMVARDGLHYGANIRMPGPGRYRLSYTVSPPSVGGLGRHSDPATGVAAFWTEPFTLRFDWDFEGLAARGR